MKTISQILVASALILFGNAAKAQDEDFEDLRILYMDEKYEKLISKAEKYSDDDDTRKNPAPYLYLSKAYYEISQKEEMNDKFPPDKAFRDALKYAGKYRRKDPEGALFSENDLYFQELKKSAIEEAAGLISDQKYSRAKRFYDGICDFDPEDAGAWLMLGYCQMQIRATTEASMSFREAGSVLHNRNMTNLNSTERKLLMAGVANYSEYLTKESKRDSVRTLLDLTKPALDGDNEFDMLYKQMN